MAAEPALEIHDVSRHFGQTAAVSEVSLSIRKGETICLVGQSGCGKSTLLRLIAGIETPDTGRISINGSEVFGPSAFIEPEARRIGFVFQDYALFPHLTALQNILFGLESRTRADAMARAAEVIQRVGIPHLADRFPHMLSGGEQQRVALARALAPQPEILLMDEPFSNLDQALRDKVRDDTLSLLKTLGTTVIMVTHDPEEALSSGDRVVLMKAGQIVQIGSGYDLHDRPSTPYAAEFFCDFNKVPGVYSNSAIQTAIGRFPHSMPLEDGSSTLVYVRPQAIAISPHQGDLSGQIEGRSFHGKFEQFLVRIDNLDEPLRIRTMNRVPQDASMVRVSIDCEQILAFS